METNISCNGDNGVVNYIMGFNVFVSVNVTLKVDTHRIDGMCANASKNTQN